MDSAEKCQVSAASTDSENGELVHLLSRAMSLTDKGPSIRWRFILLSDEHSHYDRELTLTRPSQRKMANECENNKYEQEPVCICGLVAAIISVRSTLGTSGRVRIDVGRILCGLRRLTDTLG